MSENNPSKKPNPSFSKDCINRRHMLPDTASLIALASTALPRVADAATPDVLPEPAFKGKVGRTAKDSTSDLPKGVEAPTGAPMCC